MLLERARFEIVRFGNKLLDKGLVTGTGGNLSIRSGDLVAVSPSAVEYGEMSPENIVVTDMSGAVVEGELRPSSETPLHLAVYRSRPDVLSVVHTHSPYACVMACLGWEIPVFHYLVALAGRKVPVAPYALFGTEEHASCAVRAMGGGNAVLLSNHGLLAVGRTLPEAFRVAETVEFVSMVYSLARNLGEPRLLSDDEIDAVSGAFGRYDSVNRT
ncbi:MAG: class II aldolase/adducin family protein [Thermovirgaceae bacterium]|nr:class II aldolase/adducin family protein [Thermovirgaceae bacterium]